MDFKIFYENIEILDEEVLIKLVPVLNIRSDWEKISKSLNYTIRITNLDNLQCRVEYYTYNKVLYYRSMDKKDILSIIREYTINKILNEN